MNVSKIIGNIICNQIVFGSGDKEIISTVGQAIVEDVMHLADVNMFDITYRVDWLKSQMKLSESIWKEIVCYVAKRQIKE